MKRKNINLQTFKRQLELSDIFYSEDSLLNYPTVIGYDKQFRWSWAATQLNSFFVAIDCGDELVTPQTIEKCIYEAYAYALEHNTGWSLGYQSGCGVIVFLMSTEVDQDAMIYCENNDFAKIMGGLAVPIVIEKQYGYVHYFKKKPIWGRLYYSYFKEMIKKLTQGEA